VPYSTNADLPQAVRDALPADAQTRFRQVVNASLANDKSESAAFGSAWTAVRNGWEKPKDGGQWVRKTTARSFAEVFKFAAGKTLYVNRPLLNADKLIEWAKAQGFPTTMPAEDMHVTIAYSKTPLEWPSPSNVATMMVRGGKRSVTPLGDGGAVVLKFASPDLAERWAALKDAGASWDWEGYQPHVTVTWDAAGVDLSKVQPFTGDLLFGPEEFKEIDEGWKDRMVEKVQFIKVDDSLGLVFGWAIVSKIDGEEYFDVQGDHIPEDSMLKAATDFMLDSRVAKEMHVGDEIGKIVFAFPVTADIAKAMGLETRQTGLMIAMRPDSDVLLNKFRSGEFTGFSIGGSRLVDEDVD